MTRCFLSTVAVLAFTAVSLAQSKPPQAPPLAFGITVGGQGLGIDATNKTVTVPSDWKVVTRAATAATAPATPTAPAATSAPVQTVRVTRQVCVNGVCRFVTEDVPVSATATATATGTPCPTGPCGDNCTCAGVNANAVQGGAESGEPFRLFPRLRGAFENRPRVLARFFGRLAGGW